MSGCVGSMTDVTLIINAGSSSIKFAVYDLSNASTMVLCLARGAIEDIGAGACWVLKKNELEQSNSTYGEKGFIEASNHETAFRHILNWLDQLPANCKLVAVGHRVVHGGMHFVQPERVDKSVLDRLYELVPLAPLHQMHSLCIVEHLLSQRPELLQVACFDTAFHASMPASEQIFALPRALTEQGIRRYGFHGLSYEYIASVLPDYLGERADGRVVVAHLGHGVSLCAMERRKSIATTMSFTPLDGLPMATRCGSIDAAVVLYLLREKEMTLEEVSDLLHHQSGLLGMSDISGDMRDLLESDSVNAAEAVAVFVQRIHRELASLAAAMGGLDAVVFTGGIGEHAVVVRTAICQRAGWLGISCKSSVSQPNAFSISNPDSRVSVWVIPTDEEQVVARHTRAVLGDSLTGQ